MGILKELRILSNSFNSNFPICFIMCFVLRNINLSVIYFRAFPDRVLYIEIL